MLYKNQFDFDLVLSKMIHLTFCCNSYSWLDSPANFDAKATELYICLLFLWSRIFDRYRCSRNLRLSTQSTSKVCETLNSSSSAAVVFGAQDGVRLRSVKLIGTEQYL